MHTDVGPIIDEIARDRIAGYCERMRVDGKVLYQATVPDLGYFFPPTIIAVDSIADMTEEIFGPVLHIATFNARQIDQVIGDINRSGYGLTLGLHTRIDRRAQDIIDAAKVGNLYVNRNQIGAVVESQPFGGEGLSGTGPKAGGTNYLRRFRVCGSDREIVRSDLNGIGVAKIDDAIQALNDVKPTTTPAAHILRECLRGKSYRAMAATAAFDHGPIDLPGPTGESNQLILHPIGVVLCFSHHRDNLLDIVVQALGAGNRVVAVGKSANKALRKLKNRGLPLIAIDGTLELTDTKIYKFDAIAADQSVDLNALRKTLAECSGPIKRLITEQIYPAAYMVERAICIDTTAAGGNAELLADGDC